MFLFFLVSFGVVKEIGWWSQLVFGCFWYDFEIEYYVVNKMSQLFVNFIFKRLKIYKIMYIIIVFLIKLCICMRKFLKILCYDVYKYYFYMRKFYIIFFGYVCFL